MTPKNNAKILYVDDEEINILLFEKQFSKTYTVITATSGEDGLLKLAENNDVDIVISDMSMPKMDGINFILKVKAEYPMLPCFILTAYSYLEKIEEAINNSIILDVFAKPFEKEVIDERILAVLSVS